MKVPKHSAQLQGRDADRGLSERRAQVTHRSHRRPKRRAPRWFVLISVLAFLGTLLYPSASGASPSTNHGGNDSGDCAISFFTICIVGQLPINITWPWATPSPTPKPATTQNSGHGSQSTPTPKVVPTPEPTRAATPVATTAPSKSNRPIKTAPTPTVVATPVPTATPRPNVTPKPAPASSGIDPVQISADQPSQPPVQSIAAADTNLNRGTPPRVDSAQPSQSAAGDSSRAASPASAASSTELAIYAGSATTPAPVGYSAILAAVIAGFAAGVAVVVFFAGRRRGERQI